MTQTDIEELIAQAGTVGDILDSLPPVPGYSEEKIEPCEPPRLDGAQPFPAPGIYFGMSDDAYHAIHACSASGLKKLAVSSMDYWAASSLNPDREPAESIFLDLGKAYHSRIVEGPDAYARCFAVELDKSAFDPKTLLVTTDQIKYRIAELGHKPCAKGYDDVTRAAKKEDWIAQLLDLDPDAVIWEALVAAHAREHAGMTFISAISDRRIQIAARMIEAHDQLRSAFTGGWPEVSVFYYCPATGAPMKARFDYLKLPNDLADIIDLKSFSNKQGKPIDRAIESAIATMRYNIQHVVYDDAVVAVRELIRQNGASAIATHPFASEPEREAATAWAMKWAQAQGAPVFMFVFQQTGLAPVTRGKIMPREEMGVFGTTRRRVQELKRSFVANCEVYGTDPWLDIRPVETIEDTDIPLWATEI